MESSEVSIEGSLLKLSSRGKSWNDRYFELVGNSLSYYHARGDLKPKKAFAISHDFGCEVGTLFIDHRHLKGGFKEVLYCIRVTWNVDITKDDEFDGLESRSARSSAAASSPASRVTDPHLPTDSVVITRVNQRGRNRSRGFGRKRLGFRRSRTDQLDNDSESETTPGGKRTFRSQSIERMKRPAAGHLAGRRVRSVGEIEVSRTAVATPDDQSLTSGPAPPVTMVGVEAVVSKLQQQRDYMEEERINEHLEMESVFRENQKESQRKTRKRFVEGGKFVAAAGAAVTVGVLTAGVGLVAGLLFLGAGAAAGGTGVVAGAGLQRSLKRKHELVIATPSHEQARSWKSALDTCLASETVAHSTWGQMFVMDGRKAATALVPTEIPIVRSRDAFEFTGESDMTLSESLSENRFVEPGARWRPLEYGWATVLGPGPHSLRIFQEERNPVKQTRDLSVKGIKCPPLKAKVVLNASPLHSFLCLMSLGRIQEETSLFPPVPNSGQRASFRVLERMDDHTDIIHLVFRPLYLWPSWTSPRDFVLLRYWRYDPDGTYVICLDSVKRYDCPPIPEYTRGDMHGVYTIAPKKIVRGANGKDVHSCPECLMAAVVQVDPKGWVPLTRLSPVSSQGYGEAFAVSSLMQLLEIQEALDHDRFVPVSLDTTNPVLSAMPSDIVSLEDTSNGLPIDKIHAVGAGKLVADQRDYDFAFSNRESLRISRDDKGITTSPPPFPPEKWAEPDANSFRVRGKTYKTDKVKVNAGSSIGRLIAVDVVWVDEPIFTGLSTHPTERMQLALQREKRLKAKGQPSDLPPFVFIVNISLPGPPFYHGVFYYAIDDISTIDGSDGTPSSKLCNQFFFGDSDDFRDRTFKLIPQIVEGNFIVRKAVGNTPAIMGTKLRQTYVKDKRFFEVILDCGSSSVATGVIRLSLGYAKTLVVDMGFLFEGNDASTLPERIFGCVRIKNPAFGTHLRKVEKPPR